MRPRVTLVACAAALAGGCTTEESFLVVTVANRPAVHDATTLKITLSNAGSMRTDELSLASASFPVTFSISAPDRTGPLDVSIDALDPGGFLVGRGTTATTIDAESANVLLDTTDFVVNTDFAEDQFPSDDYEAHGFQVSAGPDGTWTAAYRGTCGTPCNMFARRFDATGRAVSTRIAAGTNGFPVSTNLTEALATPATATAGTTTLAVWDFSEPSPGTTQGIACRALDSMGMGSPNQVSIATDPSSDVVSIAPLSNSNFAVTWSAVVMSNVVVRAAIVRPDCTSLVPATTVSTVTTTSARRAAVASNAGRTMYAWILAGAVRVRVADNLNAFQTPDSEFLPRTATEEIEVVRVAPLGTGFAVVVRWATSMGTAAPGRLELYRTNATGAVLGAPILVSNKSSNDFSTSQGFGVATSADGVLMVTWHACEANGDGNGCGVWARAFTADGAALGPEVLVPTTTSGDQTGPSVAAIDDAFAIVWRDASGAAPDVSGTAVRARILYPSTMNAN